jgi:DNA-binding response OmpR family regulator
MLATFLAGAGVRLSLASQHLEQPLGRITRPLTGRTILLVEDDFLVGHDLRAFLEEAGAAILGPIDDIARACGVAREQAIDGAVLDVHVWDDTAAPVAVELTARQVPFIVVSGHDPEDVPPAMRGATYLSKPVRRLELVTVAVAMFAPADRPRLGRHSLR